MLSASWSVFSASLFLSLLLSDVSVQKDADLLQSSLEALESCSFNPNLEYKSVQSPNTWFNWLISHRADVLELFTCEWWSPLPLYSLSMGCVLGLALVLSALCSSGHKDQHFHVTQTLDKLLSSLQDSSGQSRMLQEVWILFVHLLLIRTVLKGQRSVWWIHCTSQFLPHLLPKLYGATKDD